MSPPSVQHSSLGPGGNAAGVVPAEIALSSIFWFLCRQDSAWLWGRQIICGRAARKSNAVFYSTRSCRAGTHTLVADPPAAGDILVGPSGHHIGSAAERDGGDWRAEATKQGHSTFDRSSPLPLFERQSLNRHRNRLERARGCRTGVPPYRLTARLTSRITADVYGLNEPN